MGKNLRITNNLLWSRRSSVAQNSCEAYLGQGNERLLKWSWSIDQDGRYAYIWQKPFKIFFSGTKKALDLIFVQIIFAQITEDRRSTKIAKIMVLHWPLTFLHKVIFASPCICMVQYIYMGKMLRIHILDITSIIQLNWNLMVSVMVPSRHKIAKTERIKNPR